MEPCTNIANASVVISLDKANARVPTIISQITILYSFLSSAFLPQLLYYERLRCIHHKGIPKANITSPNHFNG